MADAVELCGEGGTERCCSIFMWHQEVLLGQVPETYDTQIVICGPAAVKPHLGTTGNEATGASWIRCPLFTVNLIVSCLGR